jgi:predicted amidohydrolase YtcJ
MSDIADLVITNARVHTMDPENPDAEAVAVAGNQLIAVGTMNEIQSLIGDQTKVIDAVGKSVLPGFIESHAHILSGGHSLDSLQLEGVQGIGELKSAVRKFIGGSNSDEIVFAIGAFYEIIGDGVPITRHHLDEVCPDRPFAMRAADCHTAWANTIALEKAGILNGAEIAEGSEIVMADDGQASGELREIGAMLPVFALKEGGDDFGGEDKAITDEKWQADRRALRNGMAYLASFGITSLHNMDGNGYQLELLEDLQNSGEQIVRVEIPYHIMNTHDLDVLDEAVQLREKYDTDMLWSRRIKLFMDGVMETRTAVLVEPYSDDPETHGEPVFQIDKFTEIVKAADKLGFQISTHAIGDGAVRDVLDAYEAAAEENGVRDSRHRLEHLELCLPDDIQRVARLGVVTAMQPIFATGTGTFPDQPIVDRIGEERMALSFPLRQLKEANATVAFSSDWPVATPNVLKGIKMAMTRKPVTSTSTDQVQTLEETLISYTRNGSWAEFSEDRKGILKPGMLADIVVLSEDITAKEPDRIDEMTVSTTICDGKISYQAQV